MADQQLLTQLRHVHDRYEAERTWHRFLIEAYEGSGGFAGSVKPPRFPFWGPQAEMYAPPGALLLDKRGVFAPETYLDRFSREDEEKFKSRIAVAHYLNFVQPLTDLKLSYIFRKPFHRNEKAFPKSLLEWMKNVDGSRLTFDEVRRGIGLRAALLGWTPVQIDLPLGPRDHSGRAVKLSKAQAHKAGLRPRLLPLMPANLLDYECGDDNTFDWAKVRIDTCMRNSWNGQKTRIERYTIWSRDQAEIYEVRTLEPAPWSGGVSQDPVITGANGDPKYPTIVEHKFGRVPIVIYQHRPCPEDSIRGLPMHAGVAMENKRLFNIDSELDEHTRGQVFAVLVYVTDDASRKSEIVIGADNALPLPSDAKNTHQFIAPPATVAATLQSQRSDSIQSIHRAALIETSRPSSVEVSGVTRQYDFAQTDRGLADFAMQIVKGDHDLLQVVGAGLGLDPDEVAEAKFTPPESYDVRALNEEIKNTVDALAIGLAPTAEGALRKRMRDRLLPTLDDATRAISDAEIDDQAKAESDMAALQHEMTEAEMTADEDEDEDTEEGEPMAQSKPMMPKMPKQMPPKKMQQMPKKMMQQKSASPRKRG